MALVISDMATIEMARIINTSCQFDLICFHIVFLLLI